MNRILTFRIGLAASASLAIHLAVFAAVSPGGSIAQVAGGGAEIHIGRPPGSHDAGDAEAGQPEAQAASIRVPEAKPPAPEPQWEVRPEPTPLPKPSPIAARPEVPPVEPPTDPRPSPTDTIEQPVEDTPQEVVSDTDTQAEPKEAYMGGPPSSGKLAITPADSGDTGGAAGERGADAAKGAASDTAASGKETDTLASGPGNAASTNYAGLVMQHLSKVRRPRASSPGSAVVSFTISRNGDLEDIRISQSSRSARFDRDAMMVVRRAVPFPAPPSGVNRSFSVEIEGR